MSSIIFPPREPWEDEAAAWVIEKFLEMGRARGMSDEELDKIRRGELVFTHPAMWA